jgi:ABC-type nitrate/sulfonate/bicarbonate transport system ATPase subunit
MRFSDELNVKAIARAVALKKQVLILDDVFSALNPSTKSKILNRLLGPDGLAHSSQMTVISTTHDRKSTSTWARGICVTFVSTIAVA